MENEGMYLLDAGGVLAGNDDLVIRLAAGLTARFPEECDRTQAFAACRLEGRDEVG